MMAFHVVNGFHVSNYAAFALILQDSNFTFPLRNGSDNISFYDDDSEYPSQDYITNLLIVKAIFYVVYISIFAIGICGNVLVCYVVFRNKSMQTVTNLFITNLALSDILLCTFAVPFTPLYIFISEWVFGKALCHLVPFAQGVSVYISAFTLTAIAIDRYFVIIYPFRTRLQVKYCYTIIIICWIMAGLLTLPYGLFMDLVPTENGLYCDEFWPDENRRRAFGFSTSILQFVVPFFIITFCYLKVCSKLTHRARSKPGAKSAEKEEMERERTRRTNRMLITMVVIFGASWLPINIYNLIIDFYIPATSWGFLNVIFFTFHATAMSSTCYNPFLYAWLNENFRKEFTTVLPCFENARPGPQGSKREPTARRSAACNDNASEIAVPMKVLPSPKNKVMQKEQFAASVVTTEASLSNVATITVNANNEQPVGA